MEKIQANMCFDVVFLSKNIRTCLFAHVFLYFLHLMLTFTPHYIIMVKGLLRGSTGCEVVSRAHPLLVLACQDHTCCATESGLLSLPSKFNRQK